MRLQHILIACLLFLVSLSILVDIAYHIEYGYNITQSDLTNDTNISITLTDLNIFDNTQQELYNTSQYAPGNTKSAQQDPTSTSSSISQSSWTTAIKFASTAFTLPAKIITLAGAFLHVDSRLLQTWILAITIIIVFMLISAIFFNKI